MRAMSRELTLIRGVESASPPFYSFVNESPRDGLLDKRSEEVVCKGRVRMISRQGLPYHWALARGFPSFLSLS